jgi:hypothetical protein
VAAAVVLVFAGGAFESFRPEPPAKIPPDTPLPVVLEPKGDLASPPKVFRWAPGGPDVDLAQVAIYRKNLEPLWQSSPIQGSSLEVDPRELFEGVGAGEPLVWRVREISQGRPRATSAFELFSFAVDVHGRGPAQSRPAPPPIQTH